MGRLKIKGWRYWALGLMVIIATAVLSSWAVREIYESQENIFSKRISKVILKIAQLPGIVNKSIKEIIQGTAFLGFSSDILRNEGFEGARFPCNEDDGYLLLAGLNPTSKKMDVRLIRFSDGVVIHRWSPNLNKIYQDTDREAYLGGHNRNDLIVHPFLLEDGSIIANTYGYTFKMNLDAEMEWSSFRSFHHSIDVGQEGDIWVPSVNPQYIKENRSNDESIIRDDSLAHLSSNGKLISSISFSEILIDNGLIGLLFGQHGPKLQSDLLHINSIVVARQNSNYWKKGDLLISARHLNTIFLYRPSSKKIIWYKTGPWINQHDAEFVNNYEISIFGNDVITPANKPPKFINGGNSAYLYNFRNDRVTQISPEVFRKFDIKTVTQGRFRLLEDESIYIEETERNRHIRSYPNGNSCIRYNKYDDTHTGVVGWSRYLKSNELPKLFLKKL